MSDLRKILAAAVLATMMPLAWAEPNGPSDGVSKFTEIISKLIETVEQTTTQFATMVMRASLNVIGALYGPLAIVGVILYVTHFNRYLGKQLIAGALLLAFFVEFVLPAFIL